MFNFAICRQVVQGLYCYLRNTSLKMFCDLLQFIFSDSLNVIDILLPFSIFLFIIPFHHIQTCKVNCTDSIILLRKKKHHRKKPELCFPSLMQMSSTVWLFGLGKAQAKANKQTNNQGAWRIIDVLLKARFCLQVWEGTVTPCLPVFVNPSFFSSSTYTFLSSPSPFSGLLEGWAKFLFEADLQATRCIF